MRLAATFALVAASLTYQVLRPSPESAPSRPAPTPRVDPQTPPRPPAGELEASIAQRCRSWQTTQAGYRRASPLRIGADYHTFNGTLDFRSTTGLLLSGDSADATIVAEWPDARPTIDLTGAIHAIVRDLTVRSKGGPALLLARRETGDSAGFHRFENVMFEGPVIIEASECNVWHGCTFRSMDARPALTLRNGPPRPNGYTMQSQLFVGCAFINHHGGPAILMDNSGGVLTDISFVGGDVAVQTATPAACIINSRVGVKMISFSNMRWEADAAAESIRIEGETNLHGLSIRDCTFYQRERLLHSPKAALYGCILSNITTHSTSTTPWGRPDGKRPLVDAQMHSSRLELMNAHIPRTPEPGTYPATCETP